MTDVGGLKLDRFPRGLLFAMLLLAFQGCGSTASIGTDSPGASTRPASGSTFRIAAPPHPVFPPRRRPGSELAVQVGRCEFFLPRPDGNWFVVGPTDVNVELGDTASPADATGFSKVGKVMAGIAGHATLVGDATAARALEGPDEAPFALWLGESALYVMISNASQLGPRPPRAAGSASAPSGPG